MDENSEEKLKRFYEDLNEASTSTVKRYASDWTDDGMDIVPTENLVEETQGTVIENVESTQDSVEKTDGFQKVEKKKKRNRKRKGKAKASDSKGKQVSKTDRQSKSYNINDDDLKLYHNRHRVSDKMFSHYLSKRVGYECSRKKRRLNKKEIKQLFPPVRALCLELLARVKVKKQYNVEKKAVLTSLEQSVGRKISWADIVKGRGQIPSMEKDIHLTAKENKIRKQAETIQALRAEIKKKDLEIKNLTVKLANISDRVGVLEKAEISRKQKDPYADLKKLAARGSPLCNNCLPPTVFTYVKPLVNGKPDAVHGKTKVKCCNCKDVTIYLSSGDFQPIYTYRGKDNEFFLYPKGSQVRVNACKAFKDTLRPRYRQLNATMTVPASENIIQNQLNIVKHATAAAFYEDYKVNLIDKVPNEYHQVIGILIRNALINDDDVEEVIRTELIGRVVRPRDD